jgi:nucleotidyltransferase/DNA polymerase involved in DNA repair
MLSELIAYSFGKRRARKQQERLIESLLSEEEENMSSQSIQNWSSFDQDTRSFEQLLEEAREHRANKDNQ